MKNEKLQQVSKVYEIIRNKFDDEQIQVLSSLIYGLQKKYEERQRIIDLNRELETFNKKCSWKKDFTPVKLFELPEI